VTLYKRVNHDYYSTWFASIEAVCPNNWAAFVSFFKKDLGQDLGQELWQDLNGPGNTWEDLGQGLVLYQVSSRVPPTRPHSRPPLPAPPSKSAEESLGKSPPFQGFFFNL
jgi:hypothetical protein